MANAVTTFTAFATGQPVQICIEHGLLIIWLVENS
ncbi:type I toxin-antitoxin system SymE family toxin [Photorhabdus khanii]|nr:type I toxin-antitoxin system SymE family toxin [Photorhabdus khanii]